MKKKVYRKEQFRLLRFWLLAWVNQSHEEFAMLSLNSNLLPYYLSIGSFLFPYINNGIINFQMYVDYDTLHQSGVWTGFLKH